MKKRPNKGQILTCEVPETVMMRDGEVRLQLMLGPTMRRTGVSDMNMDPRDKSIRPRSSSSTDEEGSLPDPDVLVDRSEDIGLLDPYILKIKQIINIKVFAINSS